MAILAVLRHRLSLAATLAACTAALLLIAPAGALAGTCAPPGNSGVGQYVEVVPGAGCNKPSSGPGSGNGGHGGNGGGHLSKHTSQQLAASGPAGQAVQQLVASSGTGGSSMGPGRSGQGHHKSGSGPVGSTGPAGSAATGSAPVNASGRSPLSALVHAIATSSSQGGLGLLLPILMAIVLAFMLIAALVRRRRLSS